jgi:hypothetical protein
MVYATPTKDFEKNSNMLASQYQDFKDSFEKKFLAK